MRRLQIVHSLIPSDRGSQRSGARQSNQEQRKIKTKIVLICSVSCREKREEAKKKIKEDKNNCMSRTHLGVCSCVSERLKAGSGTCGLSHGFTHARLGAGCSAHEEAVNTNSQSSGSCSAVKW